MRGVNGSARSPRQGSRPSAQPCYLTSAFTPMVFMGEEWAAATPFQFFTDFDDPADDRGGLRGAPTRVRDPWHGLGRRARPAGRGDLRRSQLRWQELDEQGHARMLQWYRDLIALRRNEFQLTDGHLDGVEVDVDEDAQWLVVRRGTLHTVVNLAASSRWHVPLRGVADPGRGERGDHGRSRCSPGTPGAPRCSATASTCRRRVWPWCGSPTRLRARRSPRRLSGRARARQVHLGGRPVTPGRSGSGLLDADHALLGDGGHQRAVLGEHPAQPRPRPPDADGDSSS